jgi:hypothetical protein
MTLLYSTLCSETSKRSHLLPPTGECDLVFLHAPNFGHGLGLDVHIRTKARYEYSYIESAAIKIGEDILQVNSWGEYTFNGVESASLTTISSFQVSHRQVSDKKHIFEITVSPTQTIQMETFKDIVAVKLEGIAPEGFLDATGLLGDYKTGKMLARDGTTVLADPDAFGQEWQVREEEPKLFQTKRAPQYPAACVMPNQQSSLSRRLGITTITEETARRLCAQWREDIEQCIYDVMATGDLEMVEAGAF